MGDTYMRQCERGHFYDDTRFDSCNYCKDGTGLGFQAVSAFQNAPVPQFQSAPAPAAPAPAKPGFKFCTNCGTKADASSKFCTGCGKPFPQTVQQPSSDIGKTVAVAAAPASPTSDIGKTVAVKPMNFAPTSDIGKTVAVQPMAAAPTSDIGKTVAVQPMAAAPTSDIGKTVAVNPVTVSPTSDIGKTVAVQPMAVPPAAVAPAAVQPVPAPLPQTAEIKNTTVKPMASETAKKLSKTQPAAFLVCISGANNGESFTAALGRNYIASGADADIRLDKDSSVSAECHAVITYNPADNKFTLSAGTGRGITYLNGNQVDVSADLNAYDRIKVGGSELLFIPVCSEKFKWETKA